MRRGALGAIVLLCGCLRTHVAVAQQLAPLSDSALCGCYTLVQDGGQGSLAVRLDSRIIGRGQSATFHSGQLLQGGTLAYRPYWYTVGSDSIKIVLTPFNGHGADVVNITLSRASLAGVAERILGPGGAPTATTEGARSWPARAVRVSCHAT